MCQRLLLRKVKHRNEHYIFMLNEKCRTYHTNWILFVRSEISRSRSNCVEVISPISLRNCKVHAICTSCKQQYRIYHAMNLLKIRQISWPVLIKSKAYTLVEKICKLISFIFFDRSFRLARSHHYVRLHFWFVVFLMCSMTEWYKSMKIQDRKQ